MTSSDLISRVLAESVMGRPRNAPEPCSFTRCREPIGSDRRKECDVLGYRFPTEGGFYCTQPDDSPCDGQVYDWKPSPPVVLSPKVERALRMTGSLTRMRDRCRSIIERIAIEPEGSHGMTARAWLSDDWIDVDATRPRKRTANCWRQIAQETLFERVAVEFDAEAREASRKEA